MKLIHKLLLGYLVISSFGVLTTYIAIRSFHNVENTFDSLTKDVVPEIELLIPGFLSAGEEDDVI